MNATTYAIDDEFGNLVTSGLSSYEAALVTARRYLERSADQEYIRIYEESGEERHWDYTRDQLA